MAGPGKSWLALYMALLVSTGRIGLGGLLPIPGPVLYLDYETDADTVWTRINQLTSALNIPLPEDFYYREMVQTVAGDIIEIAKMVLAHDIKMVVVDSGAPATAEPEAQAAVTEYFRSLRALDVTSLTIAHISKTGKLNQPFGSIFWRNAPRSNIRIFGQSEDGGFISAIRHTKANNGQLLPDRALRFMFREGGAHMTEADPAELSDIADEEEENNGNGGRGSGRGGNGRQAQPDNGDSVFRSNTRQSLIDYLRDGSKTIRELEALSGMTYSNIEKTLDRNQTTFVRINPQRGVANNWGLLARE